MPAPHFSISGAAELLERDRRTLVKAMRGVAPDSQQHRQPRWRLPVIIQALESMSQPRNFGVCTGDVLYDLDADLAHDRRTLSLFASFNRAYARMEAERNLAKRRAIAISFAPTMIDDCIRAYREHCIADGGFIDVSARADCMLSRLMIGFERSCQWSRDQVWQNLINGR